VGAPIFLLHSLQMNLVIANEITPHLTAEEYLDKGDNENELKQVGAVHCLYGG
jgi:hypothetical protein